jgi:hypothetical protein
MADRIRISYFLPLTNPYDQAAYLRTLDHLSNPQPVADGRPPVRGFTVSSSDPPVFTGFYWSDEQQIWLQDLISILFVDLPASGQIRAIAAEMKATVARFYAEEGSPQEEIWCTVENIGVI